MRIEYDANVCGAWFQCTNEWSEFSMNVVERKADLNASEETEDGVYVREVPKEEEEQALKAAKVCPDDAIVVYDDAGTQVVPEEN